MSKSKHDNQVDEMENEPIFVRNGISARIRLISEVISKIGFPIVVSMSLLVLSFYGINEVVRAINANTQAMAEFTATSVEFHQMVRRDHAAFYESLNRHGYPTPNKQ